MSGPTQDLLSVAVVGATGALGAELLDVLEERSFPITRLVPIATDRSLGREVEYAGEVYAVETEVESLEGLDLVFLCAPPEASLEYARLALEARVPCIDSSGALAAQPDVALLVVDHLDPETEIDQPLVASPTAPALVWSLVLAPLQQAAGLRRVVGTSVESASVAGRSGMEVLSGQSIALFNQQELPDEDEPVAFDCLPGIGDFTPEGDTLHERGLADALARILGAPLPLAHTAVRVPTFSGDGVSLVVQTERPLTAEDACALLAKAPGVVLWRDAAGPSTRTAAGRDEVLVGRVRSDASVEAGLQLWVSADGLRIAASNAARLAEARPLRR